MNCKINKKELRNKIKNKRDAISPNTRYLKSLKICEKFFNVAELKKDITGLNVMSFLSFSSEVDTKYINEVLWSKNANLFGPRVKSIKNRELEIVKYTKISVLKKSAYGILEPTDSKTVEASKLKVIIVPALAYDISNNRLGYGGGFYDNLLSLICTDCISIGICFREQIINEIPLQQHDKKVDKVIFE